MKRFDPIPYVLFAVSLIIIVLIAFLAGDKSNDPAKSPANITDDGNPGTIVFDQKDFYLSSQAKIQQKEIPFYNNGQGTLIVRDVSASTSTMTTALNVINSSGATAYDSVLPKAIPSGEGGNIQVKFSKEFDWKNLQNQTVTVITNDPENPAIKLNFFVANTQNNLE